MFPRKFDYVAATSIDEAVSALSSAEFAKVMSGGMSLIPMMKLRLLSPETVVDIGGVSGLDEIADRGDHTSIGALVRHAQTAVSSLPKALVDAASWTGDVQVRNRGTTCGAVAHSDIAANQTAAVLALGATMVAQGPNGTREIAAGDFYHGFLTSALEPDEMITEIRVPKMNGAGWSFQKFNRRAQDWAIVGVAAWSGAAGSGVGLVNMGSVPILATGVSDALAAGASIDDAAEQANAQTDPQSDINASVEYRQHLARVLVKRALTEAAG